MAYREVEPEPYTGGKFFKFTKVGDRFDGYFVSSAPGNFNREDYTFRKEDGIEVIISAGKGLNKQLIKAGLATGYKVIIGLKELKPVPEFPNPVPVYKVMVDDAPKVKMPAASAADGQLTDPDPFA